MKVDLKHIFVVFIVCSSPILSESEHIIKTILKSMTAAPAKSQFQAFHYLFNKAYDINSEEGLKRYKIFKQTLEYIKETNAKNLGFTVGINNFADITIDEFKAIYTSNIVPHSVERTVNFDAEADLDENEIVHNVSLDKLAPISWGSNLPLTRNQQACGSCWAFSFLTAIETCYNKNFGVKVVLSPQDLIECDPRNSCSGGIMTSVVNHVLDFGVAHDNQVPYTSGLTEAKGTCKKELKRNFILDNATYAPSTYSRDATYEALKLGALQTSIDSATEEFVRYESGIINPKCSNYSNHGIVVFGYGVDNEVEYWEIRNSYGKLWGQNGNGKMRVNTKTGSCNIDKNFILPIVKKGIIVDNVPKPAEKCATVYDDCKGQGNKITICESSPKLFKSSTLKSSIDLGKFEDSNVYIFSEENCDSGRMTLTTTNSCFKYQIKSVLIPKALTKPKNGCLIVYEDGCYTGKSREICDKDYELDFDDEFKFGSILMADTGVLAFQVKVQGTMIESKESITGLNKQFYHKAYGLKIIKA